MSVSTKIKALLTLCNCSHSLVAERLNISNQALSNKLYRDSFSAADLVKIADCANCKLCFVTKDGNTITIDKSDIKN